MAFEWTGFWEHGITQNSEANMNYSLMGVGLKSEFPAASTDFQGATAWASDEQKLYYCTGAAWVAVAPGLNIAQTIYGVQTFSSIPVLPASDPTTANQAVRKSYADGITRVVYKTTTETVNNSAAVQNDDELLVSLEANTKYVMEALLYVTSSASADFRHTWTFPVGATYLGFVLGLDYASGAITMQGFGGAVFNGGGYIKIESSFSVGANAGNLQLQWAQGSAEVSDTKVYAGSYLKITKVIA
jgi:hypothetical protein